MKENRIKKIFEILTDDFKAYTAKDISEIVNFSSKTVREDIKKLNLLLKDNGAIIKAKSGVGYRFVILDKKKFSKFIKEDWPKYALEDDLSNQEYRVNKIILRLIDQKYYIKSEDFLDPLFVSRSQLNQDLRLTREILSENHIEIVSKPHYGMKVEASEVDIRSFLVKYIEEESTFNTNILEEVSEVSTSKINKISTFVLKQFKNKGFDTNLVKYNNFINYLIISIARIKKGFLISKDNNEKPIYEKYSSIYNLSYGIACEAEKIFNIVLDDKEIEYFYINLLSKIDSCIPFEYNENIEQIIERTIVAIRNTLSINLSNDLDLKSSLIIHLTPMIKRIKYGIKLKNPLLDDIKRDHLAMECAKLCSSYIEEIYINMDELGYIALHFSASLAKLRDNLNKKNILLICASGRATARVLKYRFMHEFSKYINKLDTSDYLMAISMDLDSYDLIVSTIPINLKTDVPVIEVSAYLYKRDVDKVLSALMGEESIKEIRDFFNNGMFFKKNDDKKINRDKVLDIMVPDNKINLDKEIYIKELMKRENIASTALENNVAIPHPLNPITEENFLGVYISSTGIYWDDKRVNIVILLNLNDNIEKSTLENFYRYLREFSKL